MAKRKKIIPIGPGPQQVGYARVSTVEQNLDMQVKALLAAGVHPDLLHVEKISASSQKRPMLDWAIETLRPGDTFVVWKFDRIARSMQDLLTRLEAIRQAGASFRSLTEQVDTNTPAGQFLLHVMGAFAQLERDLIRERTKAGVAAAKARGVKFGQPKKVSDPKQMKQIRQWRKELMPVREIVEMVREKFGIKLSAAAVQKYTSGLGRRRKPKRT